MIKLFFTQKLIQYFIGLTFFIFISFSANAQLTDSSKAIVKNLAQANTKTHSPKRAALLSAALPGLGQIYNKKYWKLPIVYVGLGALAYSVNYNQSKYIKYRNAYKDRLNGVTDENFKLYSSDNLNTLTQYYHRYRDLSAIGTAVLYLLNIVDASVDAHLFTFDVSENLSVHFYPSINNLSCSEYSTALTVGIRF